MTISRLSAVTSSQAKSNRSLTLIRALSSFSAPQNDQQLQWSRLRTDHFQRSLPRLPIPKLKDSCDRYLASVRALIPDAESIARTEQIVRRFETDVGSELHQQLIQQDKQNKHTSYICAPWFDMYLRSRLPLVLNYNPFMGWKDDHRPAYNDQSIRTANLLVSALRFNRSLQDKRLEPEVFHLKPSKSDTSFWRTAMQMSPASIAWYVSALAFQAYALDMSQFERLFGSTRIPQIDCDRLTTAHQSKHVILLRHGQFYRLQVLEQDGSIRDPLLLWSAIRQLLERKPPTGFDSICAHSADDRDRWAADRAQLEAIADNRESFEQIDSALLLLCLDDSPSGSDGDDQMTLAHSALHGNVQPDASKPANRWFDKSLSVLVTPKGHAAVNFEHSWGDGVAVLRFFNDVYDDSIARPALSPSQMEAADSEASRSSADQLLSHIPIRMTPETSVRAQASQRIWFERTSRLRLEYVLFGELNREQFKRARLSPDSMFQLAFQLAYIRSFGKRVATYEACSTSAFRHGRTETVRPVSAEMVAACDAILAGGSSGSFDKQRLKPLLDACSTKHSLLTKQAAMGQGFDRHLFALRAVWQKQHGTRPLPDLYLDPVFEQMNRFVLSTSTLYGDAFSGGGFGPVIEDGLGVAYGYVDNQLGVLCSAYQDRQDATKFIRSVEQSLKDIRDIIV
jgi:carnitine O-palmitoyltransferase 2